MKTCACCSECGASLVSQWANGQLEEWWDDGHGGKRCIDCQARHIEKLYFEERSSQRWYASIGVWSIVVILATLVATQLWVFFK